MCTFLLQNAALWDTGPVHYGVCATVLLSSLSILVVRGIILFVFIPASTTNHVFYHPEIKETLIRHSENINWCLFIFGQLSNESCIPRNCVWVTMMAQWVVVVVVVAVVVVGSGCPAAASSAASSSSLSAAAATTTPSSFCRHHSIIIIIIIKNSSNKSSSSTTIITPASASSPSSSTASASSPSLVIWIPTVVNSR